MKISKLIKSLQEQMKKHGDLEIKIHNPYGEDPPNDDFENINIAHIDFQDLDSGEVIEECFVIEGM